MQRFKITVLNNYFLDLKILRFAVLGFYYLVSIILHEKFWKKSPMHNLTNKT